MDTIKSSEDRRRLLRVAREAAEAILAGRETPPIGERPIEGRFGGTFVTLMNGTRLRGCVGTFLPTENIAETIQGVTSASLFDRRFVTHPVTLAELPRIDIEISLLSDPVPATDALSLKPGVHGIIVCKGPASGCFLPKVASEREWTMEEFLANCCTMKAGLPAHAWRDADAEVFSFTAEVFSESQTR